MAGRGRGRGSGLTLTHEQQQAMGISRGDNNTPTLAPPPLFPKLEAKPLPLIRDAATDYMVIVKDQFIEYLHDSPAYVKNRVQTDGVERYSDKYKFLSLDAKQGKTLNCVWANMPVELRPKAGRTVTVRSRKRKLDDPTEINKRLQTLEQKETEDNGDNANRNENGDVGKKKDNDNDDDIEEIEEEQEYELDDGTDYANNYFDNGEEYEDEDDALDDDPVY